MKKITILFLCLFLASCYTKPKEEILPETNSGELNNSGTELKQEGMVEEAVNIIDNYYTETLPGAIRDTKNVVNDINLQQNNLEKELQNLR